ncbi:DUF2442 domain-containing protein [Petroclostridium sp. X23]|uniref:DUF2442 domain-containing protein n=1 Tax=Petroclostridium sp. X23 TaxID=3045146 RepID=UPI0024ACB771|nr:DUF2442 domain-containing protein [Petroclostridium sp. X23]WHH60957.1 DUF2442 domain-containing protein [Petroclostridium sp. X23]
MSKMVSVYASDDYKLLIDFEDGSNITFNMQKLVRTIPYFRLKDLPSFRMVKFDEKSVYWDAVDGIPEYLPLRLSIDTILFSLRD